MSTYAVWGWGDPADEPRSDDLAALAPHVTQLLGFPVGPPRAAVPLPEPPAPRVALPFALAHLGSDDPVDRARHAVGRSYTDLVRVLAGDVGPLPDLVLRPGTEQDVVDVLGWAASAGVAVVPFGGGTSVVGGVGPVPAAVERPAVSLDLGRLAGVVEVDSVSRATRVRAGTVGPAADAGLRPYGLTLRFYPQSYERSSVGGWVATRAAGHYSCRLQHIDDIVESVRAATPTGWWESRRLPGSGAGPSPDRLLLGSEGTLGVITEVWLRAQRRPEHRAAATLVAPEFSTGAQALRALVQSGRAPAAARLVDGVEAGLTGTVTGGETVLVLTDESAESPVDLGGAVEVCLEAGLRPLPTREGGQASATWGSAFREAPRLRERLVLLGVLVETFETAVTWDRLDDLVETVSAATRSALREVCGGGQVTCRLTHAYADGAAPYFTVLAPAAPGAEARQWAEIKAAASEAVLAAGGTITHHHAVGRDHVPWYERQRPGPFAIALAAAKKALDPAGILNPGVLGLGAPERLGQ